MKFRTEIEPKPFTRKIDHTRRGFSVGSCFADRIAGRLQRAKFPIVSNPAGVLYNPASIADLLEADATAPLLVGADWVLITFGTAWVYEENGRVVANCGKRPAHIFTRRRLSVEEITERFDALLGNGNGQIDGNGRGDDNGATRSKGAGALHGKQVIFTVSPVRHLKDGFEENSLGKAILRLAIAQIVEKHPDAAGYFPAFEILNDDLRDYRFFGADLVHPSAEAVEYIWEKFSSAAFDAETLKLLPQIENVVRATEHRPFAPDTDEHRTFRRKMLAEARDLAARRPEVDMSAEIAFFGDAR